MREQTGFAGKNVIKALRLPFISASALPFIFGSLITRDYFNPVKFLLGLAATVFAHLSANIINDYADSRSRVDWQDKKFYGFFGGSKLIQEGIFTEGFYLNLAVFFALLSASAVIALALILKSVFVVLIFLAVIFLGWSYSVKPLQFSYRRLGEIIIFLLFGPAVVMGGYFLQTGIFPDWKSFMLSLPFGFLTTAILYSNEIPDLQDDAKTGKMTWAGILRRKDAYLLYCILMVLVFLSIAFNVTYRFLRPAALFSLLLIFTAAKAAIILKKHPDDKTRLTESSKFTIMTQVFVSLILILAAVLKIN